MAGLAGKIQETPAVASTVWKARVEWDRGFRSEARIRDFAPATSDEPAVLGGTDTGPNPVEQLLGALGNCLAVGYAANATAAGITINDLSVDLEGDLDLHTFLGLNPDGHAGYEAIRVKVNLDSDASPEQLAEVLAVIDGKAKQAGLSRTEYLRRSLDRESTQANGPISIDELAKVATLTEDLNDPDVMSSAWS